MLSISQNSLKSDEISNSTSFGRRGRGTRKPTIYVQIMIDTRTMGAIFEISALENHRVPNFIEIGQTLVFGHFLGDPPPKNLRFLAKKSSEQKF